MVGQPTIENKGSENFRNTIKNFASGVTIITTRYNGINYGITASAVCSVSLEPPMLLVCINKKTGTQQAIKDSKSFNVHILQRDQGGLALHFAKPHSNKFKDIQYSYSSLGNPLLPDVVAQLECKLYKEISAGTHSIFVGEVVSANSTPEEPLIYLKSKFGEFRNY